MFPQIFGKYVLERELASGGMARVFLATLRGAGGFEKRLVVKQIRPELASDQSFIQRFVAEAKTTVELSHANIVPVYELGAEQGIYYIAMEFCSGVSLAELLASGPLSPSEGAYMGVEICRALDYAHRKASVVHRDVTPRNVMIDAEGMVRLIDFGIAAPASASRGGGGPLFGSLGHMPPEQLRPGPLTPAADVFAVAVLLVEAWTGHAPFRRESLEASTRAFDEPRSPLGRSEPALAPLEALIDAALAHAPEQRPQTAEEFARPLREFLRKDDLGDIARRLGERVSQRVHQLADRAAQRGTNRVSRASLGAAGDPRGTGGDGADGLRSEQTAAFGTAPSEPAAERGTQTFATREVLFEWTAKIDSAPPQPGAGATLETLEIESGVVAPSEPDSPRMLPRAHRSRARTLGLAVAAAALSLLGAGHLWSRSRALEASAAAVASGNPAGVAGDSFASAASSASAPSSAPAPSPAPAPAPAPALPRTRDGVPAERPRAPAAAAGEAPGRPSAPAPSALIHRSNTASSGERNERDEQARPAGAPSSARADLTADPIAWVSLDGVRIGRTPLHHFALTPGRHQLSFVSQLLGEKLDATISADPRAPVSVHADFTSATPQVYVR
jgi:tRNA A-37 threonylcarbamoyl transferase component Bud32